MTSRRRKRPSDSLVRKRCRHSEAEWDLCGCSFHYHLTFERIKFRGIIPGAVDLADARKKYALIGARVRNHQPALAPTTTADGLTVGPLGEDWLSEPRGRKASMIETYRGHLRVHILPVLGKKLVTAVTPEQCEYVIKHLKPQRFDRPLAQTTKMSIARTIHALFAFAVSKRKRPDNPAAGLSKIFRDGDVSPDDGVIDPKDNTKFFRPDEATHLLKTCRESFHEWYPFLRTGLQTGMRLGELRALRFDRINWRERYITVDRAWVKGRFTSPKNGKSRTVTMSRDLYAVLRLQRMRFRQGELVFPSSVGTPLETSRVVRFWTRLLTKADLPYRTRHAMRHTHDSLMIQAGVPPAKVAAESGRSLQETMRTYAHFLPGGNREDAETLAALLGRPKRGQKRQQL